MLRAAPTHDDIKFRALARKKGRREDRPVPMATFRCLDIERLFLDRYGGPQLPDDDAGIGDAEIMLQHIAHRKAKDVAWLMHDWLDRWAPWLVGDRRDQLMARVLRKSIKYKAPTLGEKLGLTPECRERLGITTFRAIGQTEATMAEARAEKNAKRKRHKRRAAGCKPRDEYLSNSLTSRQPWKEMGISRSKYYELKAAGKLPSETMPGVAA